MTSTVLFPRTSHRRCGTQIVFHSNRDGDSDIYVMETDGDDARPLTDDLGSIGRPCN